MRVAFLLSLLLFLGTYVDAQAVVPQPVPMTSCQDKQFVMFGNDDVQALPIKTATTSAPASYIHMTHFNVTQVGVTINQLSFGILANPSIASVVLLRLGLYLVSGTSISLLAQTGEIQLYSTNAITIYGNIPATQLRPGTYAIAFWANNLIYTGVGTTVTGQAPTTAYTSYNYNGLARTATLSYVYGTRALAARGCIDTSDPFAGGNNQIFAMCSWIQARTPAPTNNWQYTNTHTTYLFSAMLAVSNSDSGSSANGQWNKVLAAAGSIQVGKAGGYYYDATVALSSKSMTLGTLYVANNNQYLYTNNPQGKLDATGLSFVSTSSNEQFTIGYNNGSYVVTAISAGSREVLGGWGSISGLTLTRVTDANQPINCQPPSTFRSDLLNCPAGSSPVIFGDDDLGDNYGTYNYQGEYNYGNIIQHRPFQVRSQRTEIRQVSFQMNANPMKVIRMRMAVYSYTGTYSAVGEFTLLGQTREVMLDNIGRQVVAVNLLNPVQLEYGKNYTLAFITDMATYSPYGYYDYWPVSYDQGYDGAMANGYSQTLTPNEYLYTVPLGGYGCAKESPPVTINFCSTFVYAGYTQLYSGTLNALAPLYTDSLTGSTYYQVVSGSGTSTQITTAGTTTVLNFTVHDFNLFTNNRIYPSGASPVDKFGLQLVMNTDIGYGYAVQLASWYDPVSAELEYLENQQLFYTTSITGLRNLVSTFSISVGGGTLSCPAPARPANTVNPPSVDRVICPNKERSITDVYGDADVGTFAVHAAGTLIAANRIYTQAFVAEGSGTVRQLALGLLRNIASPDTINVRLGLYSGANNSLITQTAQLTLYQAVDQLIVMNLPFAVNLVAGQPYMIALVTSAPLQVATTATKTMPSMTFAFSASGLPTTFASSSNDVGVSIAAYVCVSSTHSFCGSYQYAIPSTGNSVTLLYQGLLQVDPTTSTNGYGTYRSILAASGRLVAYSRGPESPTQSTTLYTFVQQLGNNGKLYTASGNNQLLDNDGLKLSISDGGQSWLVFNTSINMLDESWRGDDKETDLVYSSFVITPLNNLNTPIPSCGVQSLPRLIPTPVALPTCPSGQSMVWYGDADNFDSGYSQEGYYYGEANHLFLRPITTAVGKATKIEQIKFGININYNTVSRIRMGLYNKNFKFMAGTNDIRLVNPHNDMFTGTLTQPQILAPNTVYYLALWMEYALYSGFTAGDAPAMIVPFNASWPDTFVNTVPNSQRAVGGVGCTTDESPPQMSGSSFDSSSSSSSSLSKGAVAGVVIGVVIATNLILLALFWLCCMGAAHTKQGSTDIEPSSEHSRIG